MVRKDVSKKARIALGAEGRRFESFRPDQQASRNINTGNTWEPGHASDRALWFSLDVPRCPRKSNVSPARIQVWELNVCSRRPGILVKNRHTTGLWRLFEASPEARPTALDGNWLPSPALLMSLERDLFIRPRAIVGRLLRWEACGLRDHKCDSKLSPRYSPPDALCSS